MPDQFIVHSETIKAGVVSTVKKNGNYLKLLRTTSKTPVLITLDTGFSIKLNPGQGIPIAFKTFTAACPQFAADVVADFFIGSVALIEPHKVEDNGTIFTTDTLNVPGKGGLPAKLLTIPGTITLGSPLRRKTILLQNTDGANDVYLQSLVQAFSGEAGFAKAGLTLVHGTPAPTQLNTDDDVTIANYNAAAVAVMVTQIWYPDLNT